MLGPLKWITIRIALGFAIFISTITLGTAFYIFAPLTSYIAFRDWKFWKHIHKFHILIQAGLHIYKLVLSNSQGYRDAFTLPLASPPADGPDRTKVELHPDWQYGESCGPCNQCCEQLGCNLVDENGLCMVYGSIVWRYLNCGKYPSNQAEINYFQCPKWQLKGSAYSEKLDQTKFAEKQETISRY